MAVVKGVAAAAATGSLLGLSLFRPSTLLSAEESASSEFNLLVPVSTATPDKILFPARARSPLEPVYVDTNMVRHPLQTNKFWGNWLLNDPIANFGDLSIYPAPYVLRWTDDGGMHIHKPVTDYQGKPYQVTFFTSHWLPDFQLGATQGFYGPHKITREGHFGIHAERTGKGCTTTYPIYAGMAFVTARFAGTCTPTVTSQFQLTSVVKISAGVWEFKSTRVTYRVYALTSQADFVDDSYDFDSSGTMNQNFNGWIRLAYVSEPDDVAVLDSSAGSVLTNWRLRVEPGRVFYDFVVSGPRDKFLHWGFANHMTFLRSGANYARGLKQLVSGVKGAMFPFFGTTTWTMVMDIQEARDVTFLPRRDPKAAHEATIREQITKDFEHFKTSWRLELHKIDHYFSGKGFQKLGTLCHMMAKYYGKSHQDTQECANILKEGFQCMYDRSVSDGSDRNRGEGLQEVGCLWSPTGTWYDVTYGGIPSRWDDSPICGLDFGNGCYNDHHYHWGYYLVAGAMLADLIPSMKNEPQFIELIEMYIRDVGNPSLEDPYFPQFRNFDWFDMHSWSRGLKPDPDGKDQESTSEEVNFHYGLKLWGDVMGDQKKSDLGATMLTASAEALQEYFLMLRDNKNHPLEFAVNHVTGIFFQNKVHITTWFGMDRRYIHGIQMLPLTAGLEMSRKPKFAYEEWLDQVEELSIDYDNAWWSILFSGNLAMHDPDRAFEELTKMTVMDDGLIRSWALYWTSIQEKYEPHHLAPLPTPLAPVPSTSPPSGEPSPPPSPPPPFNGNDWGPCVHNGSPCCDPVPNPPQMCPGPHECPQCGAAACQCPPS